MGNQYKKGQIITRVYNWQLIFNGDYNEVQIKGPDDKWRWLDCAYDCIHCGKCLGCHLKGSYDEDEYGNIMFKEYIVMCESSPNGLHEYTVD